jgi:hypothetical protein
MQFSEAHFGPQYACSFPNSVRLWLHNKIMRKQAEVIQNHENGNVRYIGQGEALHRIYKRHKLCGGHVYDCPSV